VNRLIATFVLALCVAVPVAAQTDFKRHALTADVVREYRAAGLELAKLAYKGDDQREEMTVDEFVKELDATPGAKPILDKHGLTSRTYALTTMSLVHAGIYLAMEPTVDKDKARQLFKSYPPETRANIELPRKNPQFLK